MSKFGNNYTEKQKPNECDKEIDECYGKLYSKYVKHPIFMHKNPSIKLLKTQKSQGETYWTQDVAVGCNETVEEYLNRFYLNFISSKFDNIFIEGPSATGKSSLSRGFNTFKINQFYDVSRNNVYNTYPEMAIIYMNLNLLLSKYKGIVVDRSIISNMAYLMVYYIMNVMVNEGKHLKSMFGLCEEFVTLYNLTPALEYFRNCKTNVLVIIDSSFEHSAKRANGRGIVTNSSSDMIKSICKEYHQAQTAAFSFLANFLRYPCIDLNYIRSNCYNPGGDTEIFTTHAKIFQSWFSGIYEKDVKIEIPQEFRTLDHSVMRHLQDIVIMKSNR
ncbi:guanosine monophosphate kinase [Homarus gammarus nudivirus]|uniref:Guanosine monophosphate kinase n=1 Tax=Homarus gammarus nudivirus TaxID=2509616 RepID=A0A411HB59_9VIRU|nr:guanosine monophosphate kinase [Homarus gammarus nudivirus]QBB28632.1 guanosine monophosphate kinase [Homarus gammarus nudivirus]